LQRAETTFEDKLKHMKKLLLAGTAAFIGLAAIAQSAEGKVTYERVSVFEARFNMNGAEQVMPQTRKDNFELHYANNQSLWRAVEKENEDDGMSHSEGGMQIRMVVAGANDVLYTNFDTKKKTEKREMFDKTFIIDDSVKMLKWKMTGETKTILNHTCMKATTTQVRQSMRMTMDDGKMERKEISDTSLITAWFTTEIPVSAGPAEYQGQLPGLILEMDVNNGRQTYKALDMTGKAEVASIKEPVGKKHYTAEEFKKERDKMLKEMEQNMQGGNRQIRIN
jgi:GLPGLI family protein